MKVLEVGATEGFVARGPDCRLSFHLGKRRQGTRDGRQPRPSRAGPTQLHDLDDILSLLFLDDHLAYDMTTARAAFISGTPDRHAFFPRLEGDLAGIRAPTNTPVLPAARAGGYIEKLQDAWSAFDGKAREVIRKNTGMLLVAAAQVCVFALAKLAHRVTANDRQGFFALMNVSVKKLNSLDPPVSAMELVCVRMVRSRHPTCTNERGLKEGCIGYHLAMLRFIHVRPVAA